MFRRIRRIFGISTLLFVCSWGGAATIASSFAFTPISVHAGPEDVVEEVSPSLINLVGGFLAEILNFIGNGIGSLTLIIIEVVVINVLTYNNFASSSIVSLGWTLVRDVVNMGVVLILLVIALKTIIGKTPFGEGAHWEQQIPRLFIGVVLVNFSRTLCGLAIDASQIVMMTFVNALTSIAAGNFAQLMLMPQATQYSAETFERGYLESGMVNMVTLASNLANAYLKLMVQVAVMVVMLLLAVAFIWRIIMLWILIIMSPLAFFSWGAMGAIKGFFGGVWSEWVGNFTAALTLGPMLSFFLWLALAASSNGNLAQAEAFPEAENQTTYGQITLEVFESTNFTGLLLAIVFLMLGMRESAKAAGKLGGLASWAINEKMGKNALRAGAWVSSRTVGNVAKAIPRAGLFLGGNALRGVGATSAGIGQAGRKFLADKGYRGAGKAVGVLGDTLGTTVSMAGKGVLAVNQEVGRIPTNIADWDKYGKNVAGRAGEQAKKALNAVGGGISRASTKGVGALAREVALGEGNMGMIGGALSAVGGNAAYNRKYNEAYESALREGLSDVDARKYADFVAGTARAYAQVDTRDGVEKAVNIAGGTVTSKVANPFLDMGSVLGYQAHHFSDEETKAAKERVAKMSDAAKIERLKQFLQDTGDKSFDTIADARQLRGLLFTDKEFEKGFRKELGNTEADKQIQGMFQSLQEEDAHGHLSIDKDAWNKARSKYLDLYFAVSDEGGRKFIDSDDFVGRSMREEAVKDARIISALRDSTTGKAENGRPVTKLDELIRGTYGIPNRKAVMPVIATSGDVGDIDGIVQRRVDLTSLDANVRDELAQRILITQNAENIVRAFENKQVSEADISPTTLANDNAMVALARSQADFSKINSALYADIQTRLGVMEAAGGRISTNDANAIRAKLLGAGVAIQNIVPGVDPTNPASVQKNANPTALSNQNRLRTQQLFRVDPSSISAFEKSVEQAERDPSGRNAATEMIVEALSREDFQKLTDMANKEMSVARKAKIKQAMDLIGRTIASHERQFNDKLQVLESQRTTYEADIQDLLTRIRTAADDATKSMLRDQLKEAERKKKKVESQVGDVKNSDDYKKLRMLRSEHRAASRYGGP